MSDATLTVNRTCCRCPRVEQTKVTIQEVVDMAKSGNEIRRGPTALSVALEGDIFVEFPFLCAICKQIVMRYVEHIEKRSKHQSALRGDSKIEVEEEQGD